jgi:hypothetical protein
VREATGPVADADQEIPAVGLADAPAKARFQGGQRVHLDIVLALAAAGHHDQSAAGELVALPLRLDPGQEVLDIPKGRIADGGLHARSSQLTLEQFLIPTGRGPA